VVENIFRVIFLIFVEHGIIHERTPPYSPQSNGVAERKNHTLTDLVNAMLETSGLSKE
jgi:transposase InsO family protein